VGFTPQGWLRRWDERGNIRLIKWPRIKDLLPSASAIVLSLEDLKNDLQAAREMATYCNILAVTVSASGALVFWRGEERKIRAPRVEEVDATGAGDIFAAAFFIRLHQTKDPWESARFANLLASASVTRRGLASTPTVDEVQAAHVKVNS
jgi:sugar/nucleoside kinase (ribokinase family)